MLERGILAFAQDPSTVHQHVHLILYEHLPLRNRLVAPVARSLFRTYWFDIDPWLRKAAFWYEVLSQDPQRKVLLDTAQGRNYLNHWTAALYRATYIFTYPKKAQELGWL